MNKEQMINESTLSYSFVSNEGVPEKYYFQFEGRREHLASFKKLFPQYKIYPGWINGKFVWGKSASWYADIPLEDPIVPDLKKAMYERMLKNVRIERHKEIIEYLHSKFDTIVVEDWNGSGMNPQPIYRPIFERAALYVYDYTEEITLKMYDKDGYEEYYKLKTPHLEEILEKRIKKAVIEINS
jgi:hypothetical protein